MSEHSPIHAPIPGLGLRSIKTAVAATLTALLYAFLPGRNPTFACIGAIFGLGLDMGDSWRNGGNRLIGTIIGGFLGLGLFWVEHQIFSDGNYYFRLFLLFLGVIVLVSLSVAFRWPGAVQPGGVVLCIILFNTPAHHIEYALNRMLDTGLGVLIALLINLLLPRHRLEKWLRLDQREKEIAAPAEKP
ncbi:MAG: aromatic acid exporter family protein [Pseudoflavonifractor sp.]|nr:aromatic acid exporter family protein [Pseudoflavonifractor sp.]